MTCSVTQGGGLSTADITCDQGDRSNSQSVVETFFDGNADYFREQLSELIKQFNLDTDGVKDLSIAALIAKMMGLASTDDVRSQLASLLSIAGTANIADQKTGRLLAQSSPAASNGKQS